MEIISCPKCNQEISVQAKSCPHCGHVIKPKNTGSSFRMRKKFNMFKIIIVILIIAGLTTTVFANNINNQGKLVNQNGLYIEEKVLDSNVTLKNIEQARAIIQSRVNSLGISGAKVYTKHNNIIAVDIPGIFDKGKVLQAIETTGKLTFIGPDKKVILTGSDVKDTSIVVSPSGLPLLELKLNSDGTKKLAAATKKFLNQRIAICMDKIMYSNPTVQSAITGGEAQITGIGNIDETKKLAGFIRSGAIPVNLKNVVFKVIKE